MTVVVFGSINMDLVVRAPRLPIPGQTLLGHTFFTSPGGKGANQAVAAARLGATVRMVGKVGEDIFAEKLRESMAADKIDIEGVRTAEGLPSGVALITVDDRGENSIVYIPGANNALTEADLVVFDRAMQGAQTLMLQLEIPIPIVIAAAERAHKAGLTVILDPAPAQVIPEILYKHIDVITPNETEAAILVGFPIETAENAARAASHFIQRGCQRVIIKMGGKGAFWEEAGSLGRMFPAYKVKAIDTVAAGDAFNAGLAVALSEGKPLDEAVRWAAATGALSTTKLGAQPSMPTRAEVLQLLESK